MHTDNRRKNPRVPFLQKAVIHVKGKLITHCSVLDISAGGARLFIEEPTNVPMQFTLQLSKNGAVHRQCRKVWHVQNELGIRFIS